MQNTNKYIIIILSGILISACVNKDEKEIRYAASGYIEATSQYDFSKAEQYASEQTKQITLNYLKSIMPYVDSSSIEKGEKAKYDIKKIEVLSDSLGRVIYHKSSPIISYTDTLKMIKESNEWKVDYVVVIPPMLMLFADSTIMNSKNSLPDKEEMRRMKTNQKESQQNN